MVPGYEPSPPSVVGLDFAGVIDHGSCPAHPWRRRFWVLAIGGCHRGDAAPDPAVDADRLPDGHADVGLRVLQACGQITREQSLGTPSGGQVDLMLCGGPEAGTLFDKHGAVPASVGWTSLIQCSRGAS